MDKYDVMRAVEDLPSDDRTDVVRWAIRKFSILRSPPDHVKGPTIKDKILASLDHNPLRLKELVMTVYGEYTASKRQLVHSRLRSLLKDGLVDRKGHGSYALAAKTTVEQEETR